MERVQMAEESSLDRFLLHFASGWDRGLHNEQISLYAYRSSHDCRDCDDVPVFRHGSAVQFVAVPTMPKTLSHEIRTRKF